MRYRTNSDKLHSGEMSVSDFLGNDRQIVNPMMVNYSDGMGGGSRQITSVQMWIDSRFNKLQPSNDSILKFVEKQKKENYKNIVLTDKGHLYLTNDTPGYCDGDKTIALQELEKLIVSPSFSPLAP